jgi:hypothetical protein
VTATPAGTNGRISRADIEAKLHQMRGEVDKTAEAAKVPLMAIAGAVGAAVVVVAFLLGKRRGRRRSTVVEIRRV